MDTEHTLKFNGNTYINVATVVILIAATLWIKDGQTNASQLAKDVSVNLENYKLLQTASSLRVNDKLDAVTALVKLNQDSHWDRQDAKTLWKQFKQLNPDLNIPEIL